MLERIHGRKLDTDHGLPQERASRLASRLLPRLHPPGDPGRRLPRRPASRERAAHRRRPPRAARLRPARAARRRDAHALALLLLALAHNRSEDVAAILLSLSLTTLDSDEPGFVHELRRKLPRYHWRPLSGIRSGEALADLQRICLELRHPPAAQLRARRQDALPGRLDRAHARPVARPDRADRAGVAPADADRGRVAPRARAALRPALHAARLALAPAAAGGADRRPARDRHAQGRRRADRAWTTSSTCCARSRTGSAPR